jgi:hypothetical protein
MARRAALTADTITAISEGCRTAEVVFLRDGRIDDGEQTVLDALNLAAGYAAWADWARRQRNSVEDSGVVNITLERERRELRQRWGDPDPLEAA